MERQWHFVYFHLWQDMKMSHYRWCHQPRDSQNDAGIWARVRAAGAASADAVPPAGLAGGVRPAASTRPAPFKRSVGEDHASKRWSGVWEFSKTRAI
ncbi:hypothetical protein LBMAG53_35150 [Planctomycetota bacterium]|nr:hypothetical protein LBMAG53_35150 [Planctomycetota bacterium]